MQPKKIMWLSPMCALDRRSGAACQMRSVLSTLAQKAGWEAYAVHMTLMDGQDEYPIDTLIGKQYAKPENQGKTLKFTRDGINHHLFYTRSSYGKNLTKEEAETFYERAKKALEEIQPDVVLTFGSSQLCKALIREARKNCKTLIFYLANPSYNDAELFRPFDQVLVPSNFQAQYYFEKIGIKSDVLRTLIPRIAQPDPRYTIPGAVPENRHLGFVTMINPSLAKGATLFARLVKMAERERPDIMFLAVEGRMTNDEWANAGIDFANMQNIWWIPNQQDVRSIYKRTSVLIFPSFWNEASGRSIAEAQLGGIPVLGSNHAGIPEQLNGGGFTFDIPVRCLEKYQIIPTEAEVRPWLDTIYKLYDDEDFYKESVQRAFDCGAMFSRDEVQKDVIERFNAFAEGENLRPPLEPGEVIKPKTHAPVVKGEKIGRNDPCPFGSGKKAKACCGTEGPAPENRAIDIKALMNDSSTREPTQDEVKYEIQMFEKSLGYKPDLESPQTFNEKIARRKLFGEVPDADYLADKNRVRQLVEERAGSQILPPLYSAIASPQELVFDDLPEQFTIMPSHMNAQLKFVTQKNPEDIRQYCSKLLQAVHGKNTNEYWFARIPPRAMFTQLLQEAKEYRLFVFHGKCQFIQIDRPGPYRTIYDPDWQVQPVCIKFSQGEPEDRPESLEQMIQAAEKIGEGYDFLRVDLFSLNGDVLFNAITLAPGAGWERFSDINNPQGSYDMDKWFGSFW